MENEKKYTCPHCGAKVSWGYAVTIADNKRYVCQHCGTHLVPKTDNIVFYRIGTIILTLVFLLAYNYLVFNKTGVERYLPSQVLMLLSTAAFYLLVLYLMIIRVVAMKRYGD